MPYDPQGVFTRVMNWQDDAANDIAILASRHDAEDDNFAQGFNEVLCRDGRVAMTGALKMGTNKITGLGNGTNSDDAVTKSQLDSQNTTINTTINTLDAQNVKLTGNQTVAGVKTFSSSPVVPTPAASDNSTKAATTAWIKTFAKNSGANYMSTFSKASNGYYKFTNGLIIQWGTSAKGSSKTVTLPTAFSNTNYKVAVNNQSDNGGGFYSSATTKTTTTFVIHSGGGATSFNNDWIAIGY